MIYLSSVIKAIETLYTARAQTKMSAQETLVTEEEFNNQIKTLKDNSIAYLLQLHPKFYRDVLKFHDWDSSMLYLNKNKETVFKLWDKNND